MGSLSSGNTKKDVTVSLSGSEALKTCDLVFRRNGRARNYIARIDGSGNISVTIPRYGTKRYALFFANEHRDWLLEEQEKARRSRELANGRNLGHGDTIRFRGLPCVLQVESDWGRPVLSFADQRLFIADAEMDLKKPLKAHLRSLAQSEFRKRVGVLADELGLTFNRVTVRDQRTRWGSCSANRTISLNWRLVLAPFEARDYVITHELIHLRHFNHSSRFWRAVEEACPNYRKHERWLDEHQEELRW